MLPEQLSNHWCSLVPQQDRRCWWRRCGSMATGHLKRHRFHRAMMRSAARLTYTRVQRAIDGHPDAETAGAARPVIKPLYGAYRVLLAAREKRGALDLDLPERLVRLGDDGHIAEIGVRERLDSHKLIEEFMVLANVAAAQALEQRHAPCLYRVHDQPDAAKLESLREFLGTLGLAVRSASACGRATSTACCTRSKASRWHGWSMRPSCAARARPSTAPTTSAISAWRCNATPTSPRRSAASPT
jgi:ribonuclease R